MSHSLDLQAYFERIGFNNDVVPLFDTLNNLINIHTKAIPFENLSPLFNLPVKIDIEAIHKKFIDEKRGGYCFEHSLYFQQVLEKIGFNVTSLSGRVLLNKHEETLTPKTHMLLLVQLNNKKYIVDIGFGGQTPNAPLLLEANKVQATPLGSYRILKRKNFYLLQVAIQHRWTNMYRFTTEATLELDYKIANWYTATHPDSHFTQRLSVALAGNDCRYILNNNQFKVYYQNGNIEKKILSSAKEMIQVLEEVFGIRTTNIPDIEEKLTKIIYNKAKEVNHKQIQEEPKQKKHI